MRKRRKHERNTEPSVQEPEFAPDTDVTPEQAEAEPEPEPEISAEPAPESPPEAEMSDSPEAEEAVEGEVLEKENGSKEGCENLPEVDEIVE